MAKEKKIEQKLMNIFCITFENDDDHMEFINADRFEIVSDVIAMFYKELSDDSHREHGEYEQLVGAFKGWKTIKFMGYTSVDHIASMRRQIEELDELKRSCQACDEMAKD